MTTKRLSARKQREEFLQNVGFIRHRQWDELLSRAKHYRVRTRAGQDLGFVIDWGEYWAAEGTFEEGQPRAHAGAGGFPTRDAAVLWLGGFE